MRSQAFKLKAAPTAATARPGPPPRVVGVLEDAGRAGVADRRAGLPTPATWTFLADSECEMQRAARDLERTRGGTAYAKDMTLRGRLQRFSPCAFLATTCHLNKCHLYHGRGNYEEKCVFCLILFFGNLL